MRALAITGIVTASWISRILSGSAMRATPPCARISAGTRSSAITAQAPASSAIRAWSAVVTSMITPPFSISARPVLTLSVPISIGAQSIEAESGGCPADDRVGRRRDHEHARGRVPQHGLDRVAERLATAPPRTDDDEVDTARLGLLREDLPGLAKEAETRGVDLVVI